MGSTPLLSPEQPRSNHSAVSLLLMLQLGYARAVHMSAVFVHGVVFHLQTSPGASSAVLGMGTGCVWVCSSDARHKAQKGGVGSALLRELHAKEHIFLWQLPLLHLLAVCQVTDQFYSLSNDFFTSALEPPLLSCAGMQCSGY